MQKKYVSMRLALLGLLATLAVSMALISCGEGNVAKEADGYYDNCLYPNIYDCLKDDIVNSNIGLINMCFSESDKKPPFCEQFIKDYCDITHDPSCGGGEPVVEPSSSSDVDPGEGDSSSSSDEEPGEDSSSSSEEPVVEPSSSSEEPVVVVSSSSEEAVEPSSSSSDFTEKLTCEFAPGDREGTTADGFNPPTVKCGEDVKGIGDIVYKDNIKPWTGMSKGVYNVVVEVVCGGGLQAKDCGDVYIGGANKLECSIPAGTKGKVGEAIAPTVTCNSEVVTTDVSTFLWAPWQNLIPTESGTFEVNVVVASGKCEDETAECGTIEIEEPLPPSSSSSEVVEPSSSSETVVEQSSSSEAEVEPSSSSEAVVEQSSSSEAVVESSSSGAEPSSSSNSPGSSTSVTVKSCEVGSIGNPVENNCYNISRPTIVCSDDSTPGATIFEHNGDGTWKELPNWKSSTDTQQLCNAGTRNVRLASVDCGTTAVNTDLPVSCGTITIPAPTNTFVCNMTATGGTQGLAISPVPTASCNGTAVTSLLTWTPANFIPTAIGSFVIKVALSSTSTSPCKGMTADCQSITVVAPTPVCNMTATTVKAGTQISPAPTVTCNGTAVPNNNLIWTPANYTPPLGAAGTNITVSAVVGGTGPCNGKTATCSNTIEVTEPNSVIEIVANSNGTYTTIPSGTSQYKCTHNGNTSLFCKYRTCSSMSDKVSITVNENEVSLTCYDKDNGAEVKVTNDGCAASGGTPEARTIIIPANKDVGCRIGY
jgi:hypothetical protein